MDRRRRGSAAVEFALTLPVWFLMIVAIADFGWLFFEYATLDAAANAGCRAGSLIDPGDRDERIERVEARANDRMLALLATLGVTDCETCTVRAWTLGRPPVRSLVCEVSREHEPLVGMFFGTLRLTNLQVARLEWQREAAEETP